MVERTHRLVPKPRMDARHLAEYMAGSDVARRSIVRACKYQKTARLLQHQEARLGIGKFVREGGDIASLSARAAQLRERLAADDFERTLWDANADYIDRFVRVRPSIVLPKADILPPGQAPTTNLNGVAVTVHLLARFTRTTRTNKVRVGGLMVRYAKDKILDAEEARWQSAILHGCLSATAASLKVDAEKALCITMDAHAGLLHEAPGDAVRRYQNVIAACATIADGWDNVKPPKGAVL